MFFKSGERPLIINNWMLSADFTTLIHVYEETFV